MEGGEGVQQLLQQLQQLLQQQLLLLQREPSQ